MCLMISCFSCSLTSVLSMKLPVVLMLRSLLQLKRNLTKEVKLRPSPLSDSVAASSLIIDLRELLTRANLTQVLRVDCELVHGLGVGGLARRRALEPHGAERIAAEQRIVRLHVLLHLHRVALVRRPEPRGHHFR